MIDYIMLGWKLKVIKNKIIKIDGLDIIVQWKRKKNLSLIIKLDADNHTPLIRVTAPLLVSADIISSFIKSKRNWINKKLINISKENISKTELFFVTGEKHLFLGQFYLLKIIYGKNRIDFNQQDIIISTIKKSTVKEKKNLLYRWYRKELMKLIPDFINKWKPIIGVECKEWKIKKMKTRWGTCNINASRIWLNLELVKKPIICLEYVIVHELIHFLERKHNRRFYNLMTKNIPDWKNIKLILNKNH